MNGQDAKTQEAAQAPPEGMKPKDGNGNLPAVANLQFGERGIQLRSFDDAFRFGKCVVLSKLAPGHYATPEQVVIAVETGAEIGLPPMIALQNINVIDGKPFLGGDIAKALVKASGKCEYIRVTWKGTFPEDNYTCVVESKRTDGDLLVTEFSIADAKTAQLWGKTGRNGYPTPWVTFPKRMMQYRALAFNLRDNFPDVLKGVHLTEEHDEDFNRLRDDKSAGQGTYPNRFSQCDTSSVPEEFSPADDPDATICAFCNQRIDDAGQGHKKDCQFYTPSLEEDDAIDADYQVKGEEPAADEAEQPTAGLFGGLV